MSDYKVQSLNGLLAEAGSCRELMEAVIPWAEPILADLGEVTPRLFFVTQDGEDGLLTPISEVTGEREKDELAHKLRRFCALRGVKACALLFTGNIRELPPCEEDGSEGPVEQQTDSAAKEGEQEADEHVPAREQLFPVGTFLCWLCGEFLGEAGRACVWKIEPSVGLVRIEEAWNIEVARGLGRFVNLLGQGRELGYPISDELRDRIAAYMEGIRARDPKPGNILSFGKGKTAGELAVETVDGPAPNRIVEKDGFLYFIGLYSGEPTRRATKSELLVAMGIGEGEMPNADEMKVEQQPDGAEAYYNRGLGYGITGDHDKAIANFTEAIRLRPDDADPYHNRGKAYGRMGDYDKAIADFTEAIRLRPDSARMYYNRGLTYGRMGDYDKLIADYTEAIRLKPDYVMAYWFRGVAYWNKGEHDRSIADLTEGIRLGPNAARYSGRGFTYWLKGDYDKAIADFTEAIRLRPDCATTYNFRGMAYGKKGDLDRAIADYNEAIRLRPDCADAYHHRGAAYKEKGENSEAEEDFARAKKRGFSSQE
jgi:tetratricopeptide (TPR) repeat protein